MTNTLPIVTRGIQKLHSLTFTSTDTSGTGWKAPPGVTLVFLVGFGGGAGGGGGAGSGAVAFKPPIGGGGGGASLQTMQIYPVTPGVGYDITIGAGGNGGTQGSVNSAGSAGGIGAATTFSPHGSGPFAIFSGAYPGQGGIVGTHAFGDGGGTTNLYGMAAGGTGTYPTGSAIYSRTYTDSQLRLGSGPGCGGEGLAYIVAVTGLALQAVPRGGFQSIEGFSGGAGGNMGGTTGDVNYTPGGPGGGGAGGPGGVGGIGGDGGTNRIGGTHVGGIGTAGTNALANTGAGGGGGGAAGTGDATGNVGGTGGNGGSGQLTVCWIE